MIALSQPPSDQSESEAEEEAASDEDTGCPEVADVRKIQIGRLEELNLKRMTLGQLLNVGEYSSTAYFRGEEKVFEERKERRYQTIVLRPATKKAASFPTKVYKVVNGELASPLSTAELEEAFVGRVQHIKETVKRQTYHEGELAFQEETTTEYDVNVEAGFTASDSR